ncbi:unnamed protein product [Haemonchus placei]|uniref:Helicase ATP-binding domain-containing protein n=1 Tax=Haemonchus placei TaxID=6290 RepID=A0A0N4XAZ2_HAEPC|nr:unnamed protein product [Haemonchus placei]
MSEGGYDSFDDEIVIKNPSVIDVLNSSDSCDDSLPPTPPPAEGVHALPGRSLPPNDDDEFSDPPPTPPPATTRKRKPTQDSDEYDEDEQNLPPTPPPIQCGDVLPFNFLHTISLRYDFQEYVHLDEMSKPMPIMNRSQSSRDNTFLGATPSQKALQTLKHYFGHSYFRPKQWDIVRNALEGKDQLVLMSTGYGKSVCYQLPGLMSSFLTLVVSPLISLMNDQVMSLTLNGVSASVLCGTTSLNQRDDIMDNIESGSLRLNGVSASVLCGTTSLNQRDDIMDNIESGSLRFLYLTPEYVENATSLLHRIKSKVRLIAIDEAHCVSQWGHDFRASYRHLAKIRNILSDCPVMALTATATKVVRKDIIDSLELINPVVVCTGFDRRNLYLSVSQMTSMKEDLTKLLVAEDNVLGRHFGGATIIYCQTRAMVESVHEYLRGQFGFVVRTLSLIFLDANYA